MPPHQRLRNRRKTYAAGVSAAVAQVTGNGNKMVQTALDLLEHEDWKARAWASDFLMDRMAGKAPAIIESDVIHALADGREPGELTDDELAAELALLSAPSPLLEEGDEDAELVDDEEPADG